MEEPLSQCLCTPLKATVPQSHILIFFLTKLKGRDTYISFNNGGFWKKKNNMDPFESGSLTNKKPKQNN